jgi:cell division protein FtsB
VLLLNRNGEKKHKSIFLRLALLSISIYIVYILIGLQSDLINSRHILEDKQKQIKINQITNKELENLLKNGSEKDFIERAARDKLDYIYSDEETYEDISGN